MSKKNAIIIFLVAIIVVSGGYFGYLSMTQDKKETEQSQEKKDEISETEEMIHYTNAVAYEDEDAGVKVTIAIENNNLVVKGITKEKTYVPKVTGLSGTLKYFTYATYSYAGAKILVLTEDGKAYVGQYADIINRYNESDFKLYDIEFEQVKSNKKIVDITKKDHKTYVLGESEVLCIKEQGEKLKGIFTNHMTGKDEIKVYDEVYPWEQDLTYQQSYVYKDGSVQIDMSDINGSSDDIKQYLVDENNQKIYIKNILIKYTTPENIDNYRETYVVDKNNRLYYLKNTKLVEADMVSYAADGNYKMKLHSNKKVSKVEVEVVPNNPTTQIQDGKINATIYYEDGTRLVLKDINVSYDFTTKKIVDEGSLYNN